jgi:hypothetical protein
MEDASLSSEQQAGLRLPAWTTTADVTPLTTKGDLFTFTTEDAR